MNYKSISLKHGRNILSTASDFRKLQGRLREIANSLELNPDKPSGQNDFGSFYLFEREIYCCDLRIIRNPSIYAIQLFITPKAGPEQIALVKVQPQVPAKKISEIGSAVQDNGSADIFQSTPRQDGENLNFFKEET